MKEDDEKTIQELIKLIRADVSKFPKGQLERHKEFSKSFAEDFKVGLNRCSDVKTQNN